MLQEHSLVIQIRCSDNANNLFRVTLKARLELLTRAVVHLWQKNKQTQNK